MRLFVALDLPAAIVAALSRIEIPPGRGVRVIRPEQMHITLHFIGDANVDAVQQALESVDCSPCRLRISGVGQFGIREGRRILWAGVSSTKELLELHAACGSALASIGIRIESRRFAPHVTLARLKPPARKTTVDQFLRSGDGREFGEFTAERFTLYDSVMKEDGARYEAIAGYPLGR